MTDDRQYRREFYRAIDQRQALDDRQSQYYVPIYDRPELQRFDVVDEFVDAIDFSGGESMHLLSGVRGSGKTSELRRLAEVIRASGRPVVYMDIEDYFNTALAPELGAFPIALAAGFIFGAGVSDETKPLLRDRFITFLKRLQIETAFTAGTELFAADVKVSLREDTRVTSQVAHAVSNNRRTVRDELHRLFREATSVIGGSLSPVLIVDSLDHFRVPNEGFTASHSPAQHVFSELHDELRLPDLHTVYTVPVYVQSPLAVRHEILNIKVADEKGVPMAPGLGTLRDVLAARAPGGDIDRLMGGREERLLLKSGGLLRDVLRLTGQLIVAARDLPATESDFERAEMVLRDGMLSLERVDILRRIRDSHELIPADHEWTNAMDLMTSGAILKYRTVDAPGTASTRCCARCSDPEVPHAVAVGVDEAWSELRHHLDLTRAHPTVVFGTFDVRPHRDRRFGLRWRGRERPRRRGSSAAWRRRATASTRARHCR